MQDEAIKQSPIAAKFRDIDGDVIKIDPREVRNLIVKMREMWRTGNMKEVVSAAEQVLNAAPANADALKMRLSAALKLRAWPTVAEAAIDASKANAPLALTAANKLASSGELINAARVLIAIRQSGAYGLEGFERSVNAHVARLTTKGARALKLGHESETRFIWRLAHELNPADAELGRRIRAMCAADIGRAKAIDGAKEPEKFIEAWKKVLEIDPRHSGALKRLAIAYEKAGDQDAALDYWARFLALNPEDASAASRIGRAAKVTGREMEALKILHDAGSQVAGTEHGDRLLKSVVASLKSSLRNEDVFGAALHLSVIGRFEQTPEIAALKKKCVAALAKAIKATDPADGAQVVALARSLVTLDPENTIGLRTLAHRYYETRHFAEAAECYDRLSKVSTENPAIWLRLARARYRSGNIPGAIEAANRAQGLAPGNKANQNLLNLLNAKLAAA